MVSAIVRARTRHETFLGILLQLETSKLGPGRRVLGPVTTDREEQIGGRQRGALGLWG